MHKTIKHRWVAALRSGRYTPDKHYLHRGEWFDPLGVLLDVLDPKGWKVWEGGPIFSFDGQISILPQSVLRTIGHAANDPCITIPGINRTVARLSDLDMSWTRIAYLIERNL